MPMYEFSCNECGNEFEELVSLNATQYPPCPGCESENVEKKISVCGSVGGSGGCGSSGFT